MSGTNSAEVRLSLNAEVFGVVRGLTLELSNGNVELLTGKGWTPELHAIVKSVVRAELHPQITISVPPHICTLWPALLTAIREHLGSAEAFFRIGYRADEITTALAALTDSVTAATRNRLIYQSSDFVNFRHFSFDADGHHAYRWVDSKRYALREPAPPGDVLRDLIATTEYRDDYIGGGVDPDGQIHGPYQLSAIAPDSYREVGRDEAEQIVRRWLATAGTIPAELRSALEPLVFEPIRAAHSIHELTLLGDAAVCVYGFIHTEFHELVLVDDTSVRMIVAADD